MLLGTLRIQPASDSAGAAEGFAFGFEAGEGFAGALGDEVALDFGGEPEGEGEHFALDVIAEAVVVFDSPHSALFVHADVQYLHNHKEVAAEARQFATDDDVVLVDFFEQVAELALGVVFCAADGFFYPVVDDYVLLLAEVVNLEALVLNGLFVAAHADVAIYHNRQFLDV